MKPIRIFRHVACEGPGYLGSFLERHKIPFEVICIDEGVPVPQELNNISGLVFMGGSMNVTDPLQWMREEEELIRNAIDKNIPVMGNCLGAQLMSAALGGEISHNENMEVGWHEVFADDDNADNEWLQDLPEHFIPFHWHADSFTIPKNATVLLHSKCRKNQAFVIKNSIALQFHLEMTTKMVKEWIQRFGSDLENNTSCTQTADDILIDLEKKIEVLHQYADVIYKKWVKGLIES